MLQVEHRERLTLTIEWTDRVIDWDTAAYVPGPSAIQHPLFIAEVPGWSDGPVPAGTSFAEDRHYLEAAIRRQVPHWEAEIFKLLLADSYSRQYFEMSLRNKRVNEEYTREEVLRSNLRPEDLLDQLEQSLRVNEDLRGTPKIQELRKRLSDQCMQNPPGHWTLRPVEGAE